MRLNKKLAAIAITATVALTATAALAYWTTAGGGDGSATAGSDYADRVVVNQDSTVSGLVPGGEAQDLTGDFTNSNVGSVSIVDVTATVTGTHKLAGTPALPVPNPGCDADDFSAITISVDEALVSAGATEGAWSGSISMLDREDTNQNDCKDAIVDISYVSS